MAHIHLQLPGGSDDEAWASLQGLLHVLQCDHAGILPARFMVVGLKQSCV